ncbi:MAG: nitroreductase [Armatimonadota bacterium]|nr:nitroreductase [Armatimonadota bacterium]MDR7549443.1 nitroreductase [Armatimonadota bacterium]
MTVLEAVTARRSVPKLKPDPIPREILEQMLEAAVWAPNHRLTEPWRFYVLMGDGKRRFAEIRRRVRAQAFPDPQAPEAARALERLYATTMATPAIIAVTCQVAADEVQREEDLCATFMGIQNMLLAATSLGVGTYLRTGEILRDPELRAWLGIEDDRRIVATIYVGFPEEVPQKRRTPASERTVWL